MIMSMIKRPLSTGGLVCSVALALFGANDAAAGKYTDTKSPIWQVGQINSALSDACQGGKFNQLVVQENNIGYIGDQGRGVTGMAMKGWNLYDPQDLAEDNVTYHFHNDGYSDCRVYVARLKARR